MHKHRSLLAHAPERLHEEISADYNDMIYAAASHDPYKVADRPTDRGDFQISSARVSKLGAARFATVNHTRSAIEQGLGGRHGRAEPSEDFAETAGTRGRFPTFGTRRAAFPQPSNLEEQQGEAQ